MQHLLAQAQQWKELQSIGDEPADIATIGSLTSVIANVIRAVVVFSGVVLFIMLVVGGMSFLFSGGDQKKLEKAKGTITGAFAGLLVLIGSYLILRLIERFTGINITTFSFQLQP
ncbi:MAG: hypothetical protein UU25_C0020G0001 [Microgenomates group bacterium GW2011_GWB1_40_9]|nr:MAG: hypothetical protein UT26_C0018G0010 [Microgenomates group bacterium GW2011_GWC1_39_12]KKR79218.1 MAG: hypothetical protein UU25_C0020G0001 [Microgenomates group bacterium GW2011_GWB1_40_9]